MSIGLSNESLQEACVRLGGCGAWPIKSKGSVILKLPTSLQLKTVETYLFGSRADMPADAYRTELLRASSASSFATYSSSLKSSDLDIAYSSERACCNQHHKQHLGWTIKTYLEEGYF